MSSVSTHFSIEPKPAIEKFLVDMRLTAERTFRRWQRVLVEAIDECPLSPRERGALVQSHPLDDYFFAGIVALHANAIRQLYPTDVAEGLMRELAIQVDRAVGRGDSVVSHIVFMSLTRIRKARLEGNDIAHDQIIETLLARIGLDKRKATQHLMTQILLRQTLGEPLALATPSWWHAFTTLYKVVRPPRIVPPVRHVTIIDPALAMPLNRRRDVMTPPPPRARETTLPGQIIDWLRSKPGPDTLRQ